VVWQRQRRWSEIPVPRSPRRTDCTTAPAKPPVKGRWGYSAQFWPLDQVPGVPAGTFTTAGNKGQYVTVVSGHDLVIVRTGVDPDGKRFLQDRLIADVVRSLGQ
jgi:hypothetical protein